MTSYWLSEPPPPRSVHGRRSRCRRRGWRRHRVLGGAPARAGGQLCVCTRPARIAAGASGRNGGFALRGGRRPFDVTAESVARRRARALGADGAGASTRSRRSPATRFGGWGAPARGRRGGARRAPGRVRGSRRRRLRGRVARDASSLRSRAGSRPRSGTFPTACCSRRAGCGGSRAWRRRRGRDSRVRARRVARRARGATVVVCTDGYPSGLLGAIEGLIIPTRGQVIATEPIPERLFEVPHYGRHGYDYWHQAEDGGIVAGGFRDVSLDSEFTADEQLTDPVQGVHSSSTTLWAASCGSTTPGPGSSAW